MVLRFDGFAEPCICHTGIVIALLISSLFGAEKWTKQMEFEVN